MRAAYPLMLDVTDRLVVIVGGGAVAARKARGLVEAGATRIRMISLAFGEGIPEAVERVEAAYRPDHLDGATLVFAATDSPTVNGEVVSEARRRNVWVNRADFADETGDFTTPAVRREGPVTLAVSAAGTPALAATIRDGLAATFDPRWRAMAEAMIALRPVLIERLTAEVRRQAFRLLASEAALETLARGGVDGLRQWVAERFPDVS